MTGLTFIVACLVGRLATNLVIEFLNFFELESSKAVFEVESSCVRMLCYRCSGKCCLAKYFIQGYHVK